jgi:hypothetical protein
MLPLILRWKEGQWRPVFNNILSAFQGLAVFIGIAYDQFQKSRSKKQSSEEQDAEIAVRQFRSFWTWLLVSWCCLYVAFTLPENLVIRVVTTFLNNTNSLTLALCYIVLDRRTVSTTDRDATAIPWKTGLMLVAGFTATELLSIAILTVFFREQTEYVLFVADLLSGFVAALTMALCLSRLHSRLLGPSSLLPVIPVVLYLYVAIQPFYVIVSDSFSTFASLNSLKEYLDSVKPVIVQLAFLFKALMFIYVMELIRSRRLMFYMINAKRIYAYVEQQWDEFISH